MWRKMSRTSHGDNLPRQMERRFPPEPASASAARRFIREMDWSNDEELTRRLATSVSEVVTNAILHAQTSFVVRAWLGVDRIRVSVRDGSSQLPTRRAHETLQPTGRGLHILDSMTDEWGVTPGRTGKTVWFEIQRQRAAVEPG